MRALASTFALAAALAAAPTAAQTAQGGQQAGPVARPLGLTQDAWNGRLRQRGESRSNPGYVRYIYNPANVFPIRTRESMITTIKLPDGEELSQAFAGDDQGFQVGIATPNSIAVKALYPGVDTNLVAYTTDGKIFTFYVRSEGYNSKTISDFLVDVIMPGASAIEGGSMTGEDQFMADQVKMDARNPAQAAERVRDPYASLVPDRREKFREYAEWSDFRPGTVTEDLGVYVPKEEAGGTIPHRVFRDDRFTYIDYGPNATQMTEWPTPLLVVQGVEGPVGFRTAGPGGRMIVMEARGSFVLRNGQRMIVVKPRSEVPAGDAQLIEYPVAGNGRMRVPRDLPPGRPATLRPDPKTVVPTEGPRTRNGEAPSVVVALPTNRKVEKAKDRRTRGTAPQATVVREIPAPAPAEPIRTATAITPVAAAGGAMGAAPTTAIGGLRPTVDASAIASYKVVLGRGTATEIEDRWKSIRVQHYAALAGKEMTQEIQTDGRSAMVIRPIASIVEGMRLCTTLGTDAASCTVKPAKPFGR